MSHLDGDWRGISNSGIVLRSYRSMLLKGGKMGKLYTKINLNCSQQTWTAWNKKWEIHWKWYCGLWVCGKGQGMGSYGLCSSSHHFHNKDFTGKKETPTKKQNRLRKIPVVLDLNWKWHHERIRFILNIVHVGVYACVFFKSLSTDETEKNWPLI